MSIKRLLHRIPSAEKLDVGLLREHRLRFHKISNNDGTAKCNPEHTGNPQHAVYGVVFQMIPDDISRLNQIEGVGNGYEQKEVIIHLGNDSVIEAFTYYATKIDSKLKSFDWYKEHVLRGARENSLPNDYIRIIEEVEFIEDTDSERRERELFIYR